MTGSCNRHCEKTITVGHHFQYTFARNGSLQVDIEPFAAFLRVLMTILLAVSSTGLTVSVSLTVSSFQGCFLLLPEFPLQPPEFRPSQALPPHLPFLTRTHIALLILFSLWVVSSCPVFCYFLRNNSLGIQYLVNKVPY